MEKKSVELNFTSKKKLLLINILHILNIKKNLVCAKTNYLWGRATHAMECSNPVLIIKLISKVEINTNLLELVHSNICELNDVLTRGGKRYFIIFIDDYSKYTYVYLMKHKY